jgi:type I protein arginine methyltransferase
MSYQIASTSKLPDVQDDSGSSIIDDEDVSDWVSEAEERTKSLFDEEYFASPLEALKHDKDVYGYDLQEEFRRLNLDFYGRMRLVNLIRKVEKMS